MMEPEINPELYRIQLSSDDSAVGYKLGNEFCLHVTLETPAAQDAAKLQLIFKEMEFVEASLLMCVNMVKKLSSESLSKSITLQYQLSSDQHNIARATYMAAVITYGKAFSKTGKGRKKLEHRDVFVGELAKHSRFHSWIMEQHRHDYVAHATSQTRERSRTVLIMPAQPSTKSWHRKDAHATFIATPPLGELEKFHHLVKEIKSHIHERLRLALAHIDDELNSYSEQQLKALFSKATALSIEPPTPYFR